MQIAMSNGLALMRWQGSRFFNDFSSNNFAWLMIGVLLGIVAFWAISRRKGRRF